MAVCVPMATKSGELHGLIDVKTNSVEFNDFKHMDAEVQKQKKEDSRLVKIMYRNTRGKHERLTKPYCKYAGDRIEIWHFIPGYVYEVPMGLVNEVNAAKLPVRSGLVSIDGAPLNKDESPLDRDQEGEQLHHMYPASF
jgi:hypothetical protein